MGGFNFRHSVADWFPMDIRPLPSQESFRMIVGVGQTKHGQTILPTAANEAKRVLTREILAIGAKGVTITKGQGAWINDHDITVFEDCLVFEVLGFRIPATYAERLGKLACSLLDQECVLFTTWGPSIFGVGGTQSYCTVHA